MFKSLLSAAAASLLAFNVNAEMPAEYLGIWETDSYGWVLLIQDDVALIGNVTSDTCNLNSGYQPAEKILDNFNFSLENGSLLITTGGPFTKMKAERLSEIPSACQSLPMPNTPEASFLTFAQTMREYYGFFDLYKVNWENRVAAAKPLITSDMSDGALLGVFKEMVRGINDIHLRIAFGDDDYTPAFGQTDGYVLDAVQTGEAPAGFNVDYLLTNIWVDSVPNQTLA